jgi:hypothetical protein
VKARTDVVSVVAEGVDELVLAHLGAALDAHLAGPVEQLVLGAVLVVLGVAAAAADGASAFVALGVGDAGRLLLAHALVAQGLVLVRVLDRGSVLVAWHGYLLLRPVARREQGQRSGW